MFLWEAIAPGYKTWSSRKQVLGYWPFSLVFVVFWVYLYWIEMLIIWPRLKIRLKEWSVATIQTSDTSVINFVIDSWTCRNRDSWLIHFEHLNYECSNKAAHESIFTHTFIEARHGEKASMLELPDMHYNGSLTMPYSINCSWEHGLRASKLHK